MGQREVFGPADPRAPAVRPKSDEEAHRDSVSVADLFASYPGVPAPVPVGPLRDDDDWDDVDPGGKL